MNVVCWFSSIQLCFKQGPVAAKQWPGLPEKINGSKLRFYLSLRRYFVHYFVTCSFYYGYAHSDLFVECWILVPRVAAFHSRGYILITQQYNTMYGSLSHTALCISGIFAPSRVEMCTYVNAYCIFKDHWCVRKSTTVPQVSKSVNSIQIL